MNRDEATGDRFRREHHARTSRIRAADKNLRVAGEGDSGRVESFLVKWTRRDGIDTTRERFVNGESHVFVSSSPAGGGNRPRFDRLGVECRGT